MMEIETLMIICAKDDFEIKIKLEIFFSLFSVFFLDLSHINISFFQKLGE